MVAGGYPGDSDLDLPTLWDAVMVVMRFVHGDGRRGS